MIGFFNGCGRNMYSGVLAGSTTFLFGSDIAMLYLSRAIGIVGLQQVVRIRALKALICIVRTTRCQRHLFQNICRSSIFHSFDMKSPQTATNHSPVPTFQHTTLLN
jgi:hypothetical protein